MFAGSRFTIAGLMTLAVFFLSNKKIITPPRKELGELALLGFVITYMNYLFFHVGLANTTGVKGAIWGGLSTFSTILFSHFFMKDDKMTIRKIVGCILGFSSIIVLNLGESMEDFAIMGEGFLLLNAICFGFGSLISKKISYQKDPIYVSGYQLLIGGLGLLFTGILGGGKFSQIGTREILLILYMSFVSAGGFFCWTSLLKYNPSSRVAIYHFLTPLFGAVFSAMVLGDELMNLRNLSALILVCLGIAVVNRAKEEK